MAARVLLIFRKPTDKEVPLLTGEVALCERLEANDPLQVYHGESHRAFLRGDTISPSLWTRSGSIFFSGFLNFFLFFLDYSKQTDIRNVLIWRSLISFDFFSLLRFRGV